MLLEVMGSELSVEYGPARAVNKVPRRLADTTRAHTRLGFQAQVDLEEGLRRLVEWWRGAKTGAPVEPAHPLTPSA
jgi:UDP-glucose 4-epimerase